MAYGTAIEEQIESKRALARKTTKPRVPPSFNTPSKAETDARADDAIEAPTREKPKKTGRPAKGKSKRAIKKTIGAKRTLRQRLRRFIGWTVLAVILVCLTPLALAALYTWPVTHPVSTLMAWRFVSGEPVSRDWVAFDAISPNVWQSVVSSEDGQYCAHKGVDWDAVNTVIEGALEGEKVRGASTIPMQTVKNVFLWPGRSYLRKALEIPLALMIDRMWGKRRVMEVYLNIAEWGPGIYGIEAAARHHFATTAANLSRAQAARLAVSLPSPLTRNPAKPSRSLGRMAQTVEGRAKQSGAYVRCLKE